VSDDDLAFWFRAARNHGRALALGVELAQFVMPRSRRIRRALEQEAETDLRVRRALDTARAAEQRKPRTYRRIVDGEIRIY
jgi:hypothetical protein